MPWIFLIRDRIEQTSPICGQPRSVRIASIERVRIAECDRTSCVKIYMRIDQLALLFVGRRFASPWPRLPPGRTLGTRVIGMYRIQYATGIVSSCINIDVTKRDISHFEVWSNKQIAVAVFVHAFLWPTATFVSLQSKVAEGMLCLATHGLHRLWLCRLSQFVCRNTVPL
jgi:hypothetical protein